MAWWTGMRKGNTGRGQSNKKSPQNMSPVTYFLQIGLSSHPRFSYPPKIVSPTQNQVINQHVHQPRGHSIFKPEYKEQCGHLCRSTVLPVIESSRPQPMATQFTHYRLWTIGLVTRQAVPLHGVYSGIYVVFCPSTQLPTASSSHSSLCIFKAAQSGMQDVRTEESSCNWKETHRERELQVIQVQGRHHIPSRTLHGVLILNSD